MSGRRHFGNVRRLRSGRYQASYWHLGRRYVARTTYATKAEANAFLDKTASTIHGAEWIDPNAGRIAFEDYANRWLDQRTDLRASTADHYRWLLDRKVIPSFGRQPLVRIGPADVRAWHAELHAATPGVARSAYRLLRAIFNTAVADEIIGKNPCRIRGAGVDRAPERSIPSVTEVAALAEAMPPALGPAVLLAAWGTLRRGEVLGLRRGDLDVERGTVHVQRSLTELRNGELVIGPPKTAAGNRLIYLPGPIVTALADHLEQFVAPDPAAPLFPATGGMHMRPKTFTLAWDAARNALGLRHVRFHDLRHFAGTMAAATGASTRELMARGGWSTVAMVTHYQHATEDRDAYLAKALEPFILSASITPATTTPDAAIPDPETPATTPDPGPATHQARGDRARSRTDRARRGKRAPTTRPNRPLTRGNDEGSSGGETRTLNLAVNSRLLCH